MNGPLIQSAALEIWLQRGPRLAAEKITFSFPQLRLNRTLFRGRGGSAYPTPYSFPWSVGPRALTALALKTALGPIPSSSGLFCSLPMLEGSRGSLAAALDYAVAKRPNWINELFGAAERDSNFVQRFFHRRNPERKRGDTVSVCFNPKLLSGASISIYVDGALEQSTDALKGMLAELELPVCGTLRLADGSGSPTADYQS